MLLERYLYKMSQREYHIVVLGSGKLFWHLIYLPTLGSYASRCSQLLFKKKIMKITNALLVSRWCRQELSNRYVLNSHPEPFPPCYTAETDLWNVVAQRNLSRMFG